MRLVYIDEAGISKPEQEPYLVVAGCVVHADYSLNGIENYLERMMHRHIPPEHHDGFVFSAKHLFNGDNKIFKRNDPDCPLERRLKIADEIMAIPGKFRVPIALGFVERAAFPRSFDLPADFPESEKTVAAHVSCFMNCAMIVEHWMRDETKNENCILVVENNDRAKKIISDVQRYHQDKKIISLLDAKERMHFPFRKIKEDPLFQPKKQSSPLILADFCAYVMKKTLMKDQRYTRFLNPIRSHLISFDLKRFAVA